MKTAVVLMFMVSAAGWFAGCATQREAVDPSTIEVAAPPAALDEVPSIPSGAPVLDEFAAVAPADELPRRRPGDMTVTRKELLALYDSGIATALRQVEVRPAYDGERFKGYTVQRFNAQASAVMSPPMQVGDVITHVNGVAIRQPDDMMRAWELLKDAAAVRIDYVRDGAPAFVEWTVVR
ncbi:MAG: hypothetical protein AAGI01_19160 [Myxococcota bacterium]